MMTREDLLQKLTEIGTCEDDAQRRALLTSVTDEVKIVYDTNETLTTANSKFEADNKKLQEYNMQLFLRVGGQQKQPDKAKEPQSEELKYENLFNEKGELK